MHAPSPDPLTIWGELSEAHRALLGALRAAGNDGKPSGPGGYNQLRARKLASKYQGSWFLTPLGRQVATPPIVFLDMDGVVSRVLEDREAPALVRLDEYAIRRLNRVVVETGARFVSSSTWRYGQAPDAAARQIEAWMRAKGFVGQVIGATPVLGPGRRGEEIQAWLDAQEVPPRAFAILDDWEPMGDLRSRTVYTDGDYLLSDLDVDRVIALLSPVGWAGRREPMRGRSRAGRGGDGHGLTAR